MNTHIWADVDRFFEKTLLADDPILNELLKKSDDVRHAGAARSNLELAGVQDSVQVLEGNAKDIL